MKRAWILVIRSILALGVLALLAFGVLLLAVFSFSRHDETRPVDAIVVLGAAQYDGRPSPVLRARLDHAVDLYRRGIAPRVIMTGGTGVGDTVSEAMVGRRYAIRHGVPDSAILLESTGQHSGQSIAGVADLMHSRGLHSALLVSDPFHMLRLRLLAWHFGIRAYSSPTRTSPIERNGEDEWAYMVRESLGIPWVLVDTDR